MAALEETDVWGLFTIVNEVAWRLKDHDGADQVLLTAAMLAYCEFIIEQYPAPARRRIRELAKIVKSEAMITPKPPKATQ